MSQKRDPSTADPNEDVVWWSRTGGVLHRSPNCPPLLRVKARSLAAAAHGDYSLLGLIRSYDFNAPVTGQDAYPPDGLMPCRRCA